MDDQYIDWALERAAGAIPEPLLYVTARVICEDVANGSGEACDDCENNARAVLSFVYSFNPNARGNERPSKVRTCVACFMSRWDGSEDTACLFHQGADYGIMRSWFKPIKPRRWYDRLLKTVNAQRGER